MDRRRFAASGVYGALLWPLMANAQSRETIARLGFLAGFPRPTSPESVSSIIVHRLRELGYVEGRNLVIDYRHAETEEHFRILATQLVAAECRVVYAHGPYALRAARAATTSIPIVGFDHESDPVAAGYAATLARPGGNVTGVFLDQSEISAKQLQLLQELVPALTRVAVLFDPAVASAQRDAVERAATRLHITTASIVWRGPDALPTALETAMRDGARGLIVLSSPRIHERGNRPLIAAAASRKRLPAIGLLSSFPHDGLLIAYGPVQRDMLRSAANLVAKALDGVPPAGLSIARPVRFALVINLRTAKALALAIPQSLLLGADEVIE